MMKKSGALQEGLPNRSKTKRKVRPMRSISSASNSLPIQQQVQNFSDFGEEQAQGILSELEIDSLLNDNVVNFPSSGPVGGVQSMSPAFAQQQADTPPGGGDDAGGGGAEHPDRRRMLNMRGRPIQRKPNQLKHTGHLNQMGLFSYTVSEGQRVLMIDKNGQGKILDGPCRVWRWGKRISHLMQYAAYPGEFLIVRHLDGSQEHMHGPAKIWFDPRIHADIQKEDALQLAAKEAVVVYSRNEGDEAEEESVQRRIVMGPEVFAPRPGEWLHTFCWHGTKGDGYKKIPGALVFQKLWLMPDQMYHDVEDVRTADDVVLTIRLMLFFELKDVERMLDETHDPIGDFINAASSDVLDLVGRYTFDEFKTKIELLNEITSYHQLNTRAEQVGYRINKVVYRGYSTTAALQSMHGQAIEARTRLKLERETERQAQELSDFKQQREFERAGKSRNEKTHEVKAELELQRQRQLQEIEFREKQWQTEQEQTEKKLARAFEQRKREWELLHEQRRQDAEFALEQKRKLHEAEAAYLTQLKEMGVDLTSYLTQHRADQVIELRGQGEGVSPHLHVEPSNQR
ncbi:MAG: hypothetical protein CL920_19635 [Deltaproteobacteria bacterium]|nr:hypothetical protein [Deltaproteobacteria bacterium]